MKYELGFIGAGNMGGALLEAAAKTAGPGKIAVYDKDGAKAASMAEKTKSEAVSSAKDIAENCGYIVLAVKPNIMASVLDEIAPVIKTRKDDFTVVTIATGITIAEIQEKLGGVPVIRIMPNTPALVGEGMIVYCGSEQVEKKAMDGFLTVFAKAGRFDKIEERLIDAASGIQGCGPAFAYMFIEALADGGVSCGLPRAAAIEYAAQMLLGSAKMVLETGDHPELLKDRVCSPGGTTIQGVRALEKGGFRSAVFEAVVAAVEKNGSIVK